MRESFSEIKILFHRAPFERVCFSLQVLKLCIEILGEGHPEPLGTMNYISVLGNNQEALVDLLVKCLGQGTMLPR